MKTRGRWDEAGPRLSERIEAALAGAGELGPAWRDNFIPPTKATAAGRPPPATAFRPSDLGDKSTS